MFHAFRAHPSNLPLQLSLSLSPTVSLESLHPLSEKENEIAVFGGLAVVDVESVAALHAPPFRSVF